MKIQDRVKTELSAHLTTSHMDSEAHIGGDRENS